MWPLLAQVRGSGTGQGMSLIERAKAGGWYPLLVIGGIAVLIAVFALLVKMKRDA
jgi:hypothetical protein